MNINKVPKRKKNIQASTLKRSQSDELLNKPTKRKTPNKKLVEIGTRSTLARSPSNAKLIKQSSKEPKKIVKQKTSKDLKKKKIVKQSKQKENKKQLDICSKTVKKFAKKKKQKQEELTQRKKIHLQYFMYRDAYVPIENTEQRKIIFKIQLIDENASRHLNKVQNIPQQQQEQQPLTHEVIKTQTSVTINKNDLHPIVLKKQFIDKATQPTERKMEKVQNADFQCQTSNQQYNQNALKEETQENQQKCFAQTLSQLQFLYLPDQKNFQGFSRSQKIHYKQLLLYMAKKFQEPDQTLDQTTVQMILNQRFHKQRGMVEILHTKGIPTHTPSIISYISNLFCYIQLHQKSSLIQRINCTYGHSMIQKFKRVKQNKSTRLNSQLIPQTTFWRFESQLHEGLDFQSETVQQSLHAHNRAIFDTVNEILLQFQPYYKTQGEPFPWGSSFETTFFCITQESFAALASQVRQRLYQYSTILAGVHFDSDQGYTSQNQRYKIHFNKIMSAQHILMRGEIKGYDDKPDIQQNNTRLLCDIGNYLQDQLIKEIALVLLSMQN